MTKLEIKDKGLKELLEIKNKLKMTPKSLIEKEIEKLIEENLDCPLMRQEEIIEIIKTAREELKNRIIHDYRIDHKSCGYVIEYIEKVMGK